MDREWLPPDKQLRLDALRQSVQFNNSLKRAGAGTFEVGPTIYARHVVADAQEFYDFLIGDNDD